MPPAPAVSNQEVAKGAGLAALSRLGALIEVIAQPAYTWMFGLTGYGVYVVLWAAINILANILDLAMGQALQRIVPAEDDTEKQHGAVKFALLTGTGLGVAAALAMTLSADWLASFVAAAPAEAAQTATSHRAVRVEPAVMDFRGNRHCCGPGQTGIRAGNPVADILGASCAAGLCSRLFRHRFRPDGIVARSHAVAGPDRDPVCPIARTLL